MNRKLPRLLSRLVESPIIDDMMISCVAVFLLTLPVASGLVFL